MRRVPHGLYGALTYTLLSAIHDQNLCNVAINAYVSFSLVDQPIRPMPFSPYSLREKKCNWPQVPLIILLL